MHCLFSFSDDSTDKINESDINLLNNNIVTSESTSTKAIAFNNSTNGNTNTHSTCTTNTDNNFNTSPASTPEAKSLANDKEFLTDNRKAPIVNGCAPPIDGEYWDIKRTYMLRSSTVRKLNELKSIHPDLNTYVSTLVDLAIAHYYDHIVNDGGIQ